MAYTFVDVEEEYKRNKELKREDVSMLKDWADKQPHLPKMTEYQVILFLHSCYYSNEAAKIAIDNFFTIRTHCPEFFADRDPFSKAVQDTFILLQAPLPTYTDEGYIVVYGRFMDMDPSKYSFAGHMKLLDMTATLWLAQNYTFKGHMVIIDLMGVTFSHITKIGLLQMKKILTYLQDAMPVRLKGMHFVNIVPFMDKLLALMKPFMKKELFDVLHLHTDDFSTLYPYVPKRCLPKNYGGEAPSFEELHRISKMNLEDNANFFIEEEKQVVDESKRPGKPKDAGEIFGVEGTFKKLDID